ncbi:MAG: enoyl-CoA hydratase/isomerase family protein [Burkholderiaceae bacterium]
MTGAVLFQAEGAVGTVTLSHPGKLGAMSRAMWRQLREVFLGIQASRELRCVVVRGEAGAFCAGGDISEYAAFRFEEASLRAFHEDEVWGGLQALLDCDVPLVAQIEGACMGAGVEIASCCDIRIAAESARFGAPIAKLGFPMAPREAELVARAAGELTAREMLLEATVLEAAEMKLRGFLNRVVPDGTAQAEVLATAHRIAALAPEAARMNKQALRAISRGVPAAEAAAHAYAYADTPEHREGVGAFMAKRKPAF